MGALDLASGVSRRFAPGALALAALLGAGCAYLPPVIPARDALDPQERVRLGNSYEAQGLRSDAVAQYEAAVSRDPGFVEGWLALGNIAFADRRFKEAEKSFRTALKAAPGHPAALNNLAMTRLARGGSPEEAEALAREALAEGGDLRPYILDTLAQIELRRRRYPEALDLVGQAVAATPAEDVFVLEQLTTTRDRIRAAAAQPEQRPR